MKINAKIEQLILLTTSRYDVIAILEEQEEANRPLKTLN